jgi:predicted RND superfamily exporter protein
LSHPTHNRWPTLWRVLLLALPTLWLGWLGAKLPTDVANRALKAPGTPEAQALAARIEGFGRDEELFALFEALPLGSGQLREPERLALERLRGELSAVAGVRRIDVAPHQGDTREGWALSLDAPNGDWTALVEALQQRLREGAPRTVRVSISGLPAAELVLARELQAEQAHVVPWVAGVLCVLLLALYRHVGLVLAILVPPVCSMLWLGGLQALAGRELTPVSVLLPPVMLTVGVAAGVHWIEAYLERLSDGRTPTQAAAAAVDELRQPALLAALTTVIGFLALAFNAIPAVADFGALAALGVALTYAFAAFITPTLLSLLASEPRSAMRRRGRSTEAFGARVADFLVGHAGAIRAAAVLLTLVGLALCTRLEVDNDPLRVLPADHPFRTESAAVAEAFGGAEVFDVLAPANSPLADPVRMGLFAAAVCALDGVAGPAGPAWISERGDWLARFVLAPSGSAQRESLFQSVEARARALGADSARVTGLAVQVARDSGRMIRGALGGALAGLGLLGLVFWIGFRSLRFALLALVPNALPCIAVNAALAAWGAPLSFATAIISSTMLGLIVDDTIHLLHRFREQRAANVEPLAAIEAVYQHGGRAIVITSLTLAAGFGAGAVGHLTTSVEFSVLAALTIVTAFFADLVLLPALLVRTRTEPQSSVSLEAQYP